jgi:hypothetical protein
LPWASRPGLLVPGNTARCHRARKKAAPSGHEAVRPFTCRVEVGYGQLVGVRDGAKAVGQFLARRVALPLNRVSDGADWQGSPPMLGRSMTASSPAQAQPATSMCVPIQAPSSSLWSARRGVRVSASGLPSFIANLERAARIRPTHCTFSAAFQRDADADRCLRRSRDVGCKKAFESPVKVESVRLAEETVALIVVDNKF